MNFENIPVEINFFTFMSEINVTALLFNCALIKS